jgi:DNA polymerase-3 subunit alpha
LWEANFLQKKSQHHTPKGLFIEKPVEFVLPALQQHPLDDAIDEIEILGFALCNVFELVNDDPSSYLPAHDLKKCLGKEVTVLGYLITTKPVRTVKNETMYFHTFIDAEGDWLDCVFFPGVATYYPVSGKGFYSMKGKVIEEFGVYTVDVQFCKKVGIKERSQVANSLNVSPLTSAMT